MNFKCCHFYVLHHHLFSRITKLYGSCGTNQCQGHRSDDSSQVAFLELCHTVILITLAIGSKVVCKSLHLTFLLSLDSVSLQGRISFFLGLFAFASYFLCLQRLENKFYEKPIFSKWFVFKSFELRCCTIYWTRCWEFQNCLVL